MTEEEMKGGRERSRKKQKLLVLPSLLEPSSQGPP